MHKVNTQIPVMFQKLEDYKVEDTRFMRVKLWLLHLEENLNGSFFSKKIVSEAIPSLANTPILGFVESNKDGEDDYSDHRRVMERKSNGKWIYKNAGIPYGLIPEDNNAKFEFRLCDDGKMREFLTVEGLLWTKWQDPIDIMSRDGIKNQSMELHEDYEGHMNESDMLFHFTKFKFYGACILGIDHNPAMKNSTIELDFELSDTDSLNSYMQDKMEQFKLFSLNTIEEQEGRESMKRKLELLTKFSKTEEDVKALEIDLEEISYEDLEIKLEKVEVEEVEVEDDTKEKNEVEVEAIETETEVKDEIEEVVETEEIEEVDLESTEISFEDLKLQFEQLSNSFSTLEGEVATLRVFKDDRTRADRKALEVELFKEYEMLEGIKEYDAIKKDSSKYESAGDLEKEIALVFARNRAKINFSNSEDEGSKIYFNLDKQNKEKITKYGDLFDRFGEQESK